MSGRYLGHYGTRPCARSDKPDRHPINTSDVCEVPRVKLLRVGPPGAERPAALDPSGQLVDLTGVIDDVTGATLAGEEELDRVRAAVADGGLPVIDAEGLRIGAPLARPGKMVCIGLNYLDDAAGTGATLPSDAVRCRT